MMYFVALAAGVIFGIAIRQSMGDVRYMVLKDETDGERKEWKDEVLRLRAQVALHIGKDK